MRTSVLIAALFLLGAAAASADDPASLQREADRLRQANRTGTANTQSALLELYGLDSQLARAEERLAALRAEAKELARRAAVAKIHLRVVRATAREAEARLEERLRQLYVEGDDDPLAVLLGAESLEDAMAALDGFGRLARQDRAIVGQVRHARTGVESAVETLAARRDALRALIAEAEAERARLVRARLERSSYLARLARERRLTEAEIARLTARADHVQARSEEIQAAAPAPLAGPSPPIKVPPPVVRARQLTVLATGYSLRGTTSTGMSVGWGVVAVDPSVIPLGTRMTIPGYGAGVAADTGGAVRGAVIDLWFPTRAQALAWGRRSVTITLH